jgi:hypothetical protein
MYKNETSASASATIVQPATATGKSEIAERAAWLAMSSVDLAQAIIDTEVAAREVGDQALKMRAALEARMIQEGASKLAHPDYDIKLVVSKTKTVLLSVLIEKLMPMAADGRIPKADLAKGLWQDPPERAQAVEDARAEAASLIKCLEGDKDFDYEEEMRAAAAVIAKLGDELQKTLSWKTHQTYLKKLRDYGKAVCHVLDVGIQETTGAPYLKITEKPKAQRNVTPIGGGS